jgi:hypothetical protein
MFEKLLHKYPTKNARVRTVTKLLMMLSLVALTTAGAWPRPLQAQQAPTAAPQQSQSQAHITITGTVLDSISGERLGYITLQELGTTNGTMTDDMGTFRLDVKAGSSLRVQCVGYRTKTVYAGKYSRNLTIRIAPSDYEIQEVVVKPKRERYRRKDNPSVELARNVIAHKGDHALTDHDYYQCERYDKMTYSFNNFDEGV